MYIERANLEISICEHDDSVNVDEDEDKGWKTTLTESVKPFEVVLNADLWNTSRLEYRGAYKYSQLPGKSES